MNRQWAPAARADPVADELVAEHERGGVARLVGRPRAGCEEASMRLSNGRHVKHGAELERETRAARMVAADRIDEQQLGPSWQRPHRRLEQRALTKREQAGSEGALAAPVTTASASPSDAGPTPDRRRGRALEPRVQSSLMSPDGDAAWA
jgi:hypothetical protein